MPWSEALEISVNYGSCSFVAIIRDQVNVGITKVIAGAPGNYTFLCTASRSISHFSCPFLDNCSIRFLQEGHTSHKRSFNPVISGLQKRHVGTVTQLMTGYRKVKPQPTRPQLHNWIIFYFRLFRLLFSSPVPSFNVLPGQDCACRPYRMWSKYRRRLCQQLGTHFRAKLDTGKKDVGLSQWRWWKSDVHDTRRCVAYTRIQLRTFRCSSTPLHGVISRKI